MVRQIEHLPPKFESTQFVDPKRLCHRQVEVDDPWSNQRIPALVTSLSRGLQHECIDVPPPGWTTQDRITRKCRIDIRPLMHSVVHRIQVAGAIESPQPYFERMPGLHRRDAVQLP